MVDEYVEIHLRYGGYWKQVKGKKRVVYEGCLSKIFVVKVDRTCLKDFKDEIVEQCPELFNFEFSLSYELPGCKPPSYAWITNDNVYMKMLQSHDGTYRAHAFLDVKVNGFDQWKLSGDDATIRNQTLEANELVIETEDPQGGGNETHAVNDSQVEESHVDHCIPPIKLTKTQCVESLPRWSPRLNQCMSPCVEGVLSTKKKLTMSKLKSPMNVLENEGKMTGESLHDDVHYMNEEFVGDPIEVENKEIEEDETDDCYSHNSYHELVSSDSNEGDLCADDSDVRVSDDDDSHVQGNSKDPLIHVGRKFDDKWQFRNDIRQHAIVHNFDAKFIKNEGKRFVIVCGADKCTWRLRATIMRQDQKTIEIRKLNPTHTCLGGNMIGNNQATAKWIARQISVQVKQNIDFSPKAIADYLRTEYQLVNIPYGRLWMAREQAKELVYGKVKDNYKLVLSLADELVRRNPGSHVARCVVGSPHTKRSRGRPKKERIMGEEENMKGKLFKRVHKCTKCGGCGHHKNTCKNPICLEDQSERCECFDLHKELVPYKQAWSWQKSVVRRRHTLVDRDKDHSDTLIVLQHPPVYTLGTFSLDKYLNFDIQNAPYDLYRTERGGEVTYHGPGQVVMYPIINLRYHKMDLHWYLRSLEEVVIRVLHSTFSIKASRIVGLTGVWETRRLRQLGLGFLDGLALNVTTDLTPFRHIVPCGIQDREVGSLSGLLGGSSVGPTNADGDLVDVACESLFKEFSEIFHISFERRSISDIEVPAETD